MAKEKKKLETTELKNRSLLREVASTLIEINSYDIQYKEQIELETLNEMYSYIDINSAIGTLVRGVTSRELIFKGEDKNEEDQVILDGQKRFNKIKRKMDFLKELCKTPFLKYTVHEIIYNEDFSINRFEYIPRELVRYDTEKKKLYLKGKAGVKIYVDNPKKWHVAVCGKQLDKPMGDSVLNTIYKTFEEIAFIKSKVNGIINKYGGTIVMFGYDSGLEDKKVKKTALDIKKMTDKNVVGIPTENGAIKDKIHLVRLSDLNTEIHISLLERLEKKVTRNLLGSNLTIEDGGGSGSYSLGNIHQEEKEKIEDEIALFVREELDKIIEIDAEIWQYDAEEYYIDINRQQDREEEFKIKNLEQDELNKKADVIVKLNQAGLEVDVSELSEIFNLKTLRKKEVVIENTNKINPFAEFSKKNTEDSNAKTIEFIENLKKKIVPALSKKIRQQINDMQSIEDIKNIDTGIDEHREALIKAELWGQYLTIKDRSKVIQFRKKSEFAVYSDEDFQDIFKMSFNEAINWFLEREPALFEQIEKVVEKYKTEFFWIKRNTDLGVTKTIYAELIKNLELGQTFEDFKKNLDFDVLGLGDDGYYLRQVYDQTMINAQAVGHWTQIQEGIEYGYVFGFYDAILDGKETALCRSLDGKIYRFDSTFWATYYPPNHFKCRSRAIAMTEEDVIENGFTVETGTPDLQLPKGFDGNIGENYIKSVKKQVSAKEKEVNKLYDEVVSYENKA